MGKPSNLNLLFTQDALSLLKSLDWPGNVRELNNATERIMIFRSDKPIDLDSVRKFAAGKLQHEADFLKTNKTFKEACNNFEREYIRRVIDECSGNMTEAAIRLDLQRPYLYEKLKKLDLDQQMIKEQNHEDCVAH